MTIRRHRTTSLALGLLATASAAALYHVAASAEATRRVEAALARVPGLHAGAISVDPWTGRVVVSHLSARADGTSVTVGRMAFRAAPSLLPQIVTPAQAAGGEAKAENIDIDFGYGKVHIPKVEASGTELSDEALAAIFDSKATTPLTERMASFTAEEISIPEATLEQAVQDMSQKVVYKDIELKHVVRGKVGEFSAGTTTLKMESKDKNIGSVEGTMGATSAKNVDLGFYARIMTDARKDANEPLTPVSDSAEIESLEFKGKGFSLKTGAITSGKFLMRPLLMSMVDFQKTMKTDPAAKPTPEQTKASMRFVADLYDSMNFEKLEVKDVVGRFGEGGKTVSLDIGTIRFGQFAKAAMGEMAMDGFGVTGPGVLVKFDSFAMRDFDFKNSLETLKTVPFDNPAAMGAINLRSFIPSLGQILVTGLDVDVPDQKHTGNADGGARDKFKIGKLDIKASNYMLGIPGTASFVIDHLVADLPPPKDPSAKQIAEMGYTSVDLSSKFGYAWNEASNTLTMTDAWLKGEGMGSVALKGVFGNVTKDLFVGDAAVTQAALLGAAVTKAELRVENDGLLTKLLTAQAKQAGITLAQLKEGLVTNARTSITQMFGDSSQANAIADAVTTFLKDPKSIQVVATSSKGFGAADLPLLQNPGELLKRLEIQASANQ